jgi:perosamine synthetase
MVLTNNGELADRCRYYKNLCFPMTGERTFLHNNIGFNYRMSNLHAAIGLAQIERLDFYVGKRRANNRHYREALKDTPGIMFQRELPGNINVYWMNGIVVDAVAYGMTRDILMSNLKADGIDTRYFFRGMHEQESLHAFGCDCRGAYPVTHWLATNGLYLPSGSNLTAGEIQYIADRIVFHSRARK